MVRPMSLPNLSEYPLFQSQPSYTRPERKRGGQPSISLAAGLIMASEPPKMSPSTMAAASKAAQAPAGNNLFYAYARRSDYAQFSPYLLTFVTADVAQQWWKLVKEEYPDSTREGIQLFTFKGDDIPGQIWDNPKFEHLRNKWFYSHFGDTSGTGGIIPLQDEKGNLITATPAPSPSVPENDLVKSPSSINSSDDAFSSRNFDFSALQSNLEKMHAMIEENSTQIKALSVAQSSGLQRMQEINETNASQIKALAEGQAKLQSLVDNNASHFIALTNSQFAQQEKMRAVLQQNAEHVKVLASGQDQLADACKEMMGAIAQLGLRASEREAAGGARGGCNHTISPPPRKLNRRVMAYTYESGDSVRSTSSMDSRSTSVARSR